jgi:hypothetical protein
MMETKQPLTVQQALDVIEGLTPEDRMTVMDVLQRRWLDQCRMEISQNAAFTLQAIRDKRAIYGSVADLKRDLA